MSAEIEEPEYPNTWVGEALIPKNLVLAEFEMACNESTYMSHALSRT